MTTYYSVLTGVEIVIMTLALQLSSLGGLPIISMCLKNKSRCFEGCLFSMTLLASFMFHTCQIYDTQIFLSELQWQRIDNIFTISSFQIVILYLCGAITPDDLILKLSTIFSTIIIQEKDPWNFTYTLLPLLSYFIVGIFIRIWNKNRRVVKYDRRKLAIGSFLLIVGSYFFLAGLQEEQDYLRLNHAGWHIFGSGFAYFCLNAVDTKPIKHSDYKQLIGKQVNL